MKHFENNTVGLNLNSGHRSVQNVTKPSELIASVMKVVVNAVMEHEMPVEI